MILIGRNGGKLIVKDQSSVDILRKGYFGKPSNSGLELSQEEALYLIDVRNAECRSAKGIISFNELASKSWKKRKFIARYFTYRDWRDRGLIIKEPAKPSESSGTATKEYPKSTLKLPEYKMLGTFFKSDLITIIDDSEKGKDIYESLWFGQYGSYKAADRGKLNKLDIYETVFLMSKNTLTLQNTDKKEVMRIATSRRKDFDRIYGVYSDWREKGYVIKTGFKFGTHFRVYFPGAKPVKSESDPSWIHSKHVIHVFPKESKLLISEWARVIRVAHSVRKTFILAVPGTLKDSRTEIDYVLYHRKGGDAENPETNSPRYAMLSLGEEEYIGGSEFAAAIKAAKSMKLELIIAIADRETSVTYYRVKQIKLHGSENEYYEIDWMQP
ncbi:MAG: tRNA-intron lyase [Candidatus Micrarchaeaceae archaeon]